MTDRKLLELAAKAVDIEHQFNTRIQAWIWYQHSDDLTERGKLIDWNPLEDDGDALRLAVKLHLSMDLFDNEILVGYTPNCNDCEHLSEDAFPDPYAATRRAIVRAAAEIGKEMK